MPDLKNRIVKNIPNAMTFSALVLGLIAIFSILFITHRLVMPFASVCIIVAGIIDGFDGYVAKRFNAQTTFGSFLDSFSDLMNFGVAPVLIVWHTGVLEEYPMAAISLMLYIFCAVYRLARFHRLADSEYFKGLPITVSGVIIAGMAYIYAFAHSKNFFSLPHIIFAGLPFILAILMVMPFRFPRIGKTV